LKPEYRPQEQSFVTERIGSVEKAEALFGFRARTLLAEGLGRVVAWRRGNRAAVGSGR
jgi:nucleoside-diphosphate-sugar epimerase